MAQSDNSLGAIDINQNLLGEISQYALSKPIFPYSNILDIRLKYLGYSFRYSVPRSAPKVVNTKRFLIYKVKFL